MSKETIKVTLKRSGAGRPPAQRAILRGLGLRRLRQTVERPNTPEIRGMIKKVIHLVEVEEE